ncbi:hypothetical protein BpHYR1_012356 [Brachionus plicatilis]|uniref:Uncharacterized protein n=1 Tax=Brachionus plicatilis TaxID=10195 RepID=A0A3M7Q5M6_BRAPC|nr:hypothetical protein BpHYR1_012356 [Brachionus plicatilis]
MIQCCYDTLNSPYFITLDTFLLEPSRILKSTVENFFPKLTMTFPASCLIETSKIMLYSLDSPTFVVTRDFDNISQVSGSPFGYFICSVLGQVVSQLIYVKILGHRGTDDQNSEYN